MRNSSLVDLWENVTTRSSNIYYKWLKCHHEWLKRSSQVAKMITLATSNIIFEERVVIFSLGPRVRSCAFPLQYTLVHTEFKRKTYYTMVLYFINHGVVGFTPWF